MRLLPKPLGLGERIDSVHLGSRLFGAVIVERTVMKEAEWDCPFVADLAPHRSRLCVPNVMRVSGRSAADEAGEGGNEQQVVCVSYPFRRGQRQFELGTGDWFGCCRRFFEPLRSRRVDLFEKSPFPHVGTGQVGARLRNRYTQGRWHSRADGGNLRDAHLAVQRNKALTHCLLLRSGASDQRRFHCISGQRSGQAQKHCFDARLPAASAHRTRLSFSLYFALWWWMARLKPIDATH
jgi:hypothetical protein